jgi:hypothetical protein
MDGRVLCELFEESSEPSETNIEYRSPIDDRTSETRIDVEDNEEVRARLRDIGYIED